jgi:uncharacterized protein (TIGR02145 family)
MNKILKATKRHRCFKISVSFLACLLFLIFSACQKTDFNQDLSKSSSTLPKKPKMKQEISDIDGNVYQTVKIDKQLWMAENLKTTRYQNGDLIGTTTPSTLDISNETTPKYQWAYNGNENNVATLGRLYTFYAVTDSRGVCPTGWHVPSDAEWTTLITYLGGDAIAGGKLKETGTAHWPSPNIGATNETGFTAIPGGLRSFDGLFLNYPYYARWWSTTEAWSGIARGRTVVNSRVDIISNFLGENDGNSVRCIKD